MKDYLDGFQSLISEVSYINPYIIVIEFDYSFQTAIQNQIVILLVRRPEDIDLIIYLKLYIRLTRLNKQIRHFNLYRRLPPSHFLTSNYHRALQSS